MAKLTFNAILVICTGNICRSPIGERLLRRLLPAARVDSAGTCGLEGRTADSQATEIAAERGTLLEGHVARRLTPAMVRDYDLILAMELEHIEQVTAIAPEARGKMVVFFGGRTPTVKTGTHLNMFMGCWSRPVWNGRNGSVNHTG